MTDQLSNLIRDQREHIISAAQALIRINSEKTASAPGAPFGPGIDRCLRQVLALCDSLGFRTKYCEGRVGWAEIGQGKEMAAILVHVDVVPAGNGWSTDPFSADIIQGRIFGRGAQDDKGPAIAAIYAVKALADSSLPLRRRVRIIFGTDEENGWECMDYYKAHEELPTLGFSPDAEFPVIYAEKGVLFVTLTASEQITPCSKTNTSTSTADRAISILDLHGGQRPNMVADSCRALLHIPAEKKDSVDAALARWQRAHASDSPFHAQYRSDERLALETNGLVAHGSTPENGRNAISMMLSMLDTLFPDLSDFDRKQASFLRFYAEKLGFETDGHSLCGKVEDEISGSLVVNPGILHMDPEHTELRLNLRYPISASGPAIAESIRQAAAPFGLSTCVDLDSPPLYQLKESPVVQTLLSVYRSFCGGRAEPLCIGGGTYARSIPNAVAFGPVFPGQPELAHCPDESISTAELILNAKIYAEAIYQLAK